MDREVIPIAIHCVTNEGPEEMRQSHTTIATVEKIADGTYLLKALKQKLFVDGLCYLLQEIYGIENKHNEKVTKLYCCMILIKCSITKYFEMWNNIIMYVW